MIDTLTYYYPLIVFWYCLARAAALLVHQQLSKHSK